MSARIEHTLDVLIAAGLENETSEREKVERMLDSLQEDEWGKLWELCGRHQIGSIAWAGLEKYPQVKIPEKIKESLREVQKNTAYQYYCMLSFSTLVLSILEEAGIQCYLLKGVALNSLYPREDMRKLADVDVYVPCFEEYCQADSVLRSHGFDVEKGLAEFHSGYRKEFGGAFRLLELHWRPCDVLADSGVDKAVVKIYNQLRYQPDRYQIAGTELPVLPPAENAFQLLLHMFQHFVREGFGLRLLCDWCVFWKVKGHKVEEAHFLKHLKATGLTGFAWTVTRVCIDHLGLSAADVPWMERMKGACHCHESSGMMYQDIVRGGEFGKGEKSRVVIMESNPFILLAYAKTVHRMMRSAYPKLYKWVITWPVLWAITIWTFLRNNRRMGRGTARDVIASAKQRNVLMKQMKVFEKRGRKKQ